MRISGGMPPSPIVTSAIVADLAKPDSFLLQNNLVVVQLRSSATPIKLTVLCAVPLQQRQIRKHVSGGATLRFVTGTAKIKKY
jgi:hypothetical protein